MPLIQHPLESDGRRVVVGAGRRHVLVDLGVHGAPARVLVSIMRKNLARGPYRLMAFEFVHEVARAGALRRDDDEARAVDGRSACRGDVVAWQMLRRLPRRRRDGVAAAALGRGLSSED